MILCWAADSKSVIHDHANSHCIVKVLDGQVEESLYDWPDNESYNESHLPSPARESPAFSVKKRQVYEQNQVSYMHDKLGLHRIGNPSPSKGAVTLHVYSPPYSKCQAFCEKTATARSSGNICFYSINGIFD
jgi:cysteine dioxygenase